MNDKQRPLEHCHFCGDATGRAGIADDSIYLGTIGPFCENCYGETGYYALEQRVEMVEEVLDVERLAAIEHTQWMAWARIVMDEEPGLSPERRERWQSMMIPFENLPDEIKEYDREWARIVIGKPEHWGTHD